jgi:phage-related protein
MAERASSQGPSEVPGAGKFVEIARHELRRPIADFLRAGIYELRPTYQGINYRILYFFSGRNVVVISHGITKETEVADIEISRAIERKKRYEADPTAHGWKE